MTEGYCPQCDATKAQSAGEECATCGWTLQATFPLAPSYERDPATVAEGTAVQYCNQCGTDRSALPPGTPCPDCGHTIQSAIVAGPALRAKAVAPPGSADQGNEGNG